MEAENLQISLASLTSADLQAREQILSNLGDQSELEREMMIMSQSPAPSTEPVRTVGCVGQSVPSRRSLS